MAVNPAVVKLIITAATDKRTWIVIGSIVCGIILMIVGRVAAFLNIFSFDDSGSSTASAAYVQFIDDMKPYILGQFNELIAESLGNSDTSKARFLDIYNDKTHSVDGSWALTPWIVKKNRRSAQQWLGPSNMEYEYKLKWRIK